MSKVTIDGIAYASKKEAVLALKPNAYVKFGVYITHIDPGPQKQFLEKARYTMRKTLRYKENDVYRE